MATDYRRAAKTVTVPLNDGRVIVVNKGDVVDFGQTSESFRKALDSGDRYYDAMFESSSSSDFDKQEDERSRHPDPAAQAMHDVEALTKERTERSRAERFGDTPPEVLPARMDEGRTLPESGADTPADARYAKGTVDTSEAGKDQTAQLKERGVEPGESAADKGVEPDTPGSVGLLAEEQKSSKKGKKADED